MQRVILRRKPHLAGVSQHEVARLRQLCGPQWDLADAWRTPSCGRYGKWRPGFLHSIGLNVILPRDEGAGRTGFGSFMVAVPNKDALGREGHPGYKTKQGVR